MSAVARLLAPLGQGFVAGVFGLALAARLAFLFLADQPLLYQHQYAYFTNALRIAEHAEPLRYVLGSDEWRTWDEHWTIAPLYYVFAAAVFRVLGPHLLWLQLIQCLLDSVTAVLVAVLGRRLAGPRGVWAGVAYALYWPAIETTSCTLTENVHTFLLVAGITLLAREEAPSLLGLFAAGAVLGLSALARSVGSAYLGLLGLWRLWADGPRRGLVSALLLGAGGACVILPWTARNVLLIGEPVLIETTAFENIWYANHFVDRDRYLRQQRAIERARSPAEKRHLALEFAWNGVRRHPWEFPRKVVTNFWHFLRPEGLQNLLGIERSLEPWRHAFSVLLDDAILLGGVALFCVFVFAGRASRARSVLLLWVGYYLLMVVVVFHNEIRYRSAFVPFALAGAAQGAALLADRESRARFRVRAAALLGIALAFAMLRPYLAPAFRAARAALALPKALEAAERGDLEEAQRLAREAAALDPRSARPWSTVGQRLALDGHVDAALAAYREAQARCTPANWGPRLALARLLQAGGQPPETEQARRDVEWLSWSMDPWLVLEIAWQELPPPRTDEVRLGRDDYGAARGFSYPLQAPPRLRGYKKAWNDYERVGGEQPPPGPHRWSRHRAWLRLAPATASPSYAVTLEMGSPFPSPLASVEVVVRAGQAAPARLTLDRELRPYTLRAPAPGDGVLLVQLDSPTWCRAGEPAEMGVRVDRISVAPAP